MSVAVTVVLKDSLICAACTTAVKLPLVIVSPVLASERNGLDVLPFTDQRFTDDESTVTDGVAA